jgi:hypothetical protein
MSSLSVPNFIRLEKQKESMEKQEIYTEFRSIRD